MEVGSASVAFQRHIITISEDRTMSARKLILTIAVSAGSLAADGAPADVRPAVQRGLALMQLAGTNWIKNKTCFACHHQTLPMLAINEAALSGCATDASWMKSQSAHTDRYFHERIDVMDAGDHVPGGSFTVGYGLWAMSLAGRTPDATTEAMVGYLLKIQGVGRLNGKEPSAAQQQKGKWVSSCSRVPLQSSEIAATVLAITGMETFATLEQRPLLKTAREHAEKWLAQAPLTDNEDRIWRLWGLHRLGGVEGEIGKIRAAIVAAQHADGGWAQTDDMRSDAFATGEALFVLRVTGSPKDDPVLVKARDFLLKTQLADGSWLVEAHVKAVQLFFENGDPHGKHQFISTAATAWAVAALAQLLDRPAAP